MKATGIIRRTDDLGRIVIPKAIRNSLKIQDGEPLEFFIDGNIICLKKYNTTEIYINELVNLTKEIYDDYLNNADSFNIYENINQLKQTCETLLKEKI